MRKICEKFMALFSRVAMVGWHGYTAAVCGVAMGIALAGCIPRYTKPLYPGPTTQAGRNFEALWQGARRVLTQRGFKLDRQDRRDGVMVTYAATRGHFFELWRRDAANIFSLRENTTQKIFRAVKVSLHRVEGTDRYDLKVEVLAARSDKEPIQLSDTSQVSRVARGPALESTRRGATIEKMLTFDDLRRRPPGDDLRSGSAGGVTKTTLTPLGRDSDLEADLAEAIQDKAKRYDPAKSTAWITP